MKPTVFLASFLFTALLHPPDETMAQEYRIDRFQRDSLADLITLGWQSREKEVYSVESSTDLISWNEVKTHPLALMRFTATGNRTDIEFSAPAAPSAFYRIRKLPVLEIGAVKIGGGTIILKDVNNTGRVVGYHTAGAPGTGFTWAPGEQLVTFGAGSIASAVNNEGVVVGTIRVFNDAHFFSWTAAGGLVDLGDGAAVDINASGHILGYEVDPNRQWTRAFLWKPGIGKTYLPHLDPATETTVPAALNDSGQVVGDSLIDESYYRAFFWTEAGGIVDIANAQSNAQDVNSSGQVIGNRTLSDGSSRAYVWSATGGMVTLPDGAQPSDINDHGQVVGTYLTRGFVWSQAGGLIDLGALDPDGLASSAALKVNEKGQTIGVSPYPINGVGSLDHGMFWSTGTGMVRLATLSYPRAFASLVNDQGLVFGTASKPNSETSYLVMWDMSHVQ